MAGKPDVITGRIGENLTFCLSEPITLAPGWYRIKVDGGAISIEPVDTHRCSNCGDEVSHDTPEGCREFTESIVQECKAQDDL